MSKISVARSYAQSLVWVAFFVAFTIGESLIVELVFFDLIHGNPHRTLGNVIDMMVLQTPLIGVIAIIGTFLVFTLPQLFQAAVVNATRTVIGRARLAVFVAFPLTVVLTWYSYDYLTPSDFNLGINAGPDWTPYQHGISIERYLMTSVFQAPVTLFGFLYFEVGFRGISRRPLLIATLAITTVIGAIWGYNISLGQIRLQQSGEQRSDIGQRSAHGNRLQRDVTLVT